MAPKYEQLRELLGQRKADVVLKEELGPLYVGPSDYIPRGVADLDTVSEATFQKCKGGEIPLFDEGWQGWPKDTNQDVLHWFAGVWRKRKLDVGFVSDPNATQDSRCHWPQILVRELKSNPAADKPSEAWLDLGRYAQEVLAAQDTRRFVLASPSAGCS
ncbi:hypothetical protein PG988_006624 [Apiospora saccharicola]